MNMGDDSGLDNLFIEKIFGSSSDTKSCFSHVGNLIAYAASGGVVVSKIEKNNDQRFQVISQRFFCAHTKSQRSCFDSALSPHVAKDTFGFLKPEQSIIVKGDTRNIEDDTDLPRSSNNSDLTPARLSPSKIRDRIKTTSCLSLSPDEKFLIVGETGHHPRVLLFSLAPDSNDFPVFVIHHHSYGIANLKFHPTDPKIFLSLGLINDGFLHIWRLQGTGIQLIASNKTSAIVKDVIWCDKNIITYGVRHLKVWKFEHPNDQLKSKVVVPRARTAIKGKNVLLGKFIDVTFIDATVLNENQLVLLTNTSQLIFYDSGSIISSYDLPEDLHDKVENILVDLANQKLWSTINDSIRPLDLDYVLTHQKKSKALPLSTSKSQAPSPVKHNSLFGTATAVTSLPTVAFSSLSHLSFPRNLNSDTTVLAIKQFGDSYILYITNKGEIGVFDVIVGEKHVIVLPVLSDISGFKRAFSKQILLWSKEGECKIIKDSALTTWDPEILPQIELFKEHIVDSQITAMELFEDISGNSNVVVGDKVGNLMIYEKSKEGTKTILNTRAHSSAINDVVYFTVRNEFQSSVLVSISRDRMIQVFLKRANDIEWSLSETLANNKANVICMARVENKIYVASSDRTVSIYRFEMEDKGLVVHKEKMLTLKSTPVALGLHDNTIIVSTQDKQLVIFDSDNNHEILKTLKLCDEHSDGILIDNFIVNGKAGNATKQIICSSSFDKALRCYNYNSGRLIKQYYCHSEPIVGLCKLEDGKLLSISSNGCLFFWSPRKETEHNSESTVFSDQSSIVPSTPPPQKSVERKIRKAENNVLCSPASPVIKAKVSPVKLQHLTPRSASTLTPPMSNRKNISPVSNKRVSPSGPLVGQRKAAGIFSSNTAKHGSTVMQEDSMVALLSQLREFRVSVSSGGISQHPTCLKIVDEIKMINSLLAPCDEVLEKYSTQLIELFNKKLGDIS